MTAVRSLCSFYAQLLLLVASCLCDCHRIQANYNVVRELPQPTIVYVVSLQNTSQANSQNAGRLDQFIRDWSEICAAQTPLPFQFKLCSGILDARRGIISTS